MKFLCNNIFIKNFNDYNESLQYDLDLKYIDYFFEKNFIRNKKFILKSKLGVVDNQKKSSLIRDKDISFTNQYINLNQKRGKKHLFFKSFNKNLENIFYSLTHYNDDFKIYKNYENLVFLFNSGYYHSKVNDLMFYLIKDLESIFEIKTIKNNKKLKLPNKYSHEIVYIPKQKRLKYVLRALSIYKESFKNYSLWERLFWSFLLTILNKNNSFLVRRRSYIYLKSIKFFKLNKNN